MAANLKDAGVDYDMFGLSFYPFWDGTNENMQNAAKLIEDKYGKEVYIAETSYCYTSEDGDGFSNSLKGTDDLTDGYGATVQSQATVIRDICAAANEAGVEGVFYWEGTWIRRTAMRIIPLCGRNTEAVGQAVIRLSMTRMMQGYTMEAVPGTIRQCLILPDTHWLL